MSEQTYSLSAEAAEAYESTFVPALFREWAHRLIEFAVPTNVRDRIADECRNALSPFVDESGGLAGPIEVHLLAARAR